MRRRTLFELGFGIVALGLIVVAWPRLTGHAVPICSVYNGAPGVSLTLEGDVDSLRVALGQTDHAVTLTSKPPNDLRTLQSVQVTVYPELDQTPGRSGNGEGAFSCTTYPQGLNPDQLQIDSSPGYSTGWFETTVAWQRQSDLRIVLAPPPSIAAGTTTPWRVLAVVSHLEIRFEWRQTPTTLEVRRLLPAGTGAVQWSGGTFQVRKRGATFGPEGRDEVATLPLAETGIRDGEINLAIVITVHGADISTDVIVK